jgi:glycine cleavage system transcriptional repressor
MSRHVVLTAIGADRPGLVEEVSEFVLTRGGSIEDSRMANLQGQFAIMMLVSGPKETTDRLESDFGALRSQSRIDGQVTAVVTTDPSTTTRLPFRLTGQALDEPGLVHQVANLLRTLDVNIESMETTLKRAPVTAAPLFAMELIVAVPAGTAVTTLREEIARVCDSLNIDWHLAAL